jgi:nucleoside-diphosphate-sugar epimerase
MTAAAAPSADRTALITGAGGFTGRHLGRALRQRGYRVVSVTQSPEALDLAQDHLDASLACDILDLAKLTRLLERVRPTHVVHLAAVSFVADTDVQALYLTNIVGTRNLLQALADSGCAPRSVILASSANVYGNADVDPIDEQTLPRPENDYAVSKLAMEAMSRLWLDRLPITLVRPFNYTGVGQSERFVLPKIVGHFARGARRITLGNIDVERDFSDVRSIVQAYCQLLEKAPAGETFNICSGRTVSLRSVLGMMEQIAGYRIEVRSDPALRRAREIQRLRGSDAKLRARVGERLQPPLEQTLREMFEAMSATVNQSKS